MRVRTALLLGAMCCWLSCRPVDEGTYYHQAMASLDNKDYGAAAEAFQRALLNKENTLSAHLQLAMMFERQEERLPLAVWHYRAYLAMAPPDDGQVDAVRQWLERTERALLASLRLKLDQASDEERVMRVKLLEEHAQRQKNWISMLEQENRQLRESLAEERKVGK
ncbi:MAG: hypothetical protein GX945_08860 [Lentisphaerae bacterium]|jgi:hypothetical protein|nr:hypothetical protein [Lentisphaerota bacterium]